MRGLISMIKTRLKRPVRSVVFTVPNSFGRFQLNVIRSACMVAGLILLPQPTAVALLYTQQQLQASASRESERIALIFKMDVGYCHIAVIATSKTKFRIKASIGSAIGAEDLLGNMTSHLLLDSDIFKKHVHKDTEIKSMDLLRGTIQEATTQLSSQASVEVDLEWGDDLKIHKVMMREEFEDVNKEVFEKCERLIIQCLQDAEVEAKNINDVIIVGGCWNIPKVKNLVTKICKRDELYRGMNPLVAALQGAAARFIFRR